MPRGVFERKPRAPRPLLKDMGRVLAHFWKRVERRGPDECWAWTGQVGASNRPWQRYGQFTVSAHGKSVNVRAHRLAWMLMNGEIPEGMNVLHRCDNTNCVNPAHLFVGTQKENVEDQRAKGRLWYGERNGRAKLTASDVLYIRQCDESDAELARRYGVYESTIYMARIGKKWPHLPGARTYLGRGVYAPAQSSGNGASNG